MVPVPVALPADTHRSYAGQRAAQIRRRLADLGGRLVRPHRAALANLASIPLTVLGAAAIDFAAFHLAHGWGWLVTGISLVLLEHLIADET